jgi:hypothetical protein
MTSISISELSNGLLKILSPLRVEEEPFAPFWLTMATGVRFSSASRPRCREGEGIDVSEDG